MPTDLPVAQPPDSRDAVDRALLARIAEARDRDALEALYVRFKPRLARFLRRLSSDEALIEEAFNDVMLKVWSKAHQFQGNSKVASWIFSIAYRTALRMVKKQQRMSNTIEFYGDDLPEAPAAETISRGANHAELVRAVRRLSAKHRLVVELCYFEGYSLQEIAQIVNAPVNTVKTRLHHARRNLRTFFEEAQLNAGEGMSQ